MWCIFSFVPILSLKTRNSITFKKSPLTIHRSIFLATSIQKQSCFHCSQQKASAHTCSLDKCLSTLLFSVFWDMRGPNDSMLFRVSSRM